MAAIMWLAGLFAGKPASVSNLRSFSWGYTLSRGESSSFTPGSVMSSCQCCSMWPKKIWKIFITLSMDVPTDSYFQGSAPTSSPWGCSTPPKPPINLGQRESHSCAGSRKVKGEAGQVPLPYSDFQLILLLSASQCLTIF